MSMIDLKDAPWQDGFRAGDHGSKGIWTVEDIDAAIEDFSPAFEAAPINTDHESGGPAKGWIGALRRVGDVLQWKPRKIDAALKSDVDHERYIRQSIELYRKHPKTGRPYVRGIALLGNSAPAVRGLRPVKFSDDVEGYKDEAGNEYVRLECDFRGGGHAMPAGEKKPQDQDAAVRFTAEEFQAAQVENQKLKSEIEKFKASESAKDEQIKMFSTQIAELQNYVVESRRQAKETRVDAVLAKFASGPAPKITPAELPRLRAALIAADTEQTIAFGAEKKSQYDLLVESLDARAPVIKLGDKVPDSNVEKGGMNPQQVRAKVQARIDEAVKQGILKSATGPDAALFADRATKELMSEGGVN